MKVLSVFVIALLALSAQAELFTADNAEQVNQYIERFKDGEVALFFYDGVAQKEQNEGGFFSFITRAFTAEDTDTALEKQLADKVTLVKIDTSNNDFAQFQYEYMVDQLPYIVVLKHNKVILKEVPNDLTHDKVVDLFENFIDEVDSVPSVEEDKKVAQLEAETDNPEVEQPETEAPVETPIEVEPVKEDISPVEVTPVVTPVEDEEAPAPVVVEDPEDDEAWEAAGTPAEGNPWDEPDKPTTYDDFVPVQKTDAILSPHFEEPLGAREEEHAPIPQAPQEVPQLVRSQKKIMEEWQAFPNGIQQSVQPMPWTAPVQPVQQVSEEPQAVPQYPQYPEYPPWVHPEWNMGPPPAKVAAPVETREIDTEDQDTEIPQERESWEAPVEAKIQEVKPLQKIEEVPEVEEKKVQEEKPATDFTPDELKEFEDELKKVFKAPQEEPKVEKKEETEEHINPIHGEKIDLDNLTEKDFKGLDEKAQENIIAEALEEAFKELKEEEEDKKEEKKDEKKVEKKEPENKPVDLKLIEKPVVKDIKPVVETPMHPSWESMDLVGDHHFDGGLVYPGFHNEVYNGPTHFDNWEHPSAHPVWTPPQEEQKPVKKEEPYAFSGFDETPQHWSPEHIEMPHQWDAPQEWSAPEWNGHNEQPQFQGFEEHTAPQEFSGFNEPTNDDKPNHSPHGFSGFGDAQPQEQEQNANPQWDNSYSNPYEQAVFNGGHI